MQNKNKILVDIHPIYTQKSLTAAKKTNKAKTNKKTVWF